MTYSAVVDSALVDAALYQMDVRPYHICMQPTANPALYQMEKNN